MINVVTHNKCSVDDAVRAVQRHDFILDIRNDFALEIRLNVAQVSYMPITRSRNIADLR